MKLSMSNAIISKIIPNLKINISRKTSATPTNSRFSEFDKDRLFFTKGIILASMLMVGSSWATMSYAASYQLDPTHTNVRFGIDHFNTSTNTGGFYNLTGELVYDLKKQQGDISLTIPLKDINTGNKAFDKVLLSSDFFDVDTYPTAHFKSTQWYFGEINSDPDSLEDDQNDDKDEGLQAKAGTVGVTEVEGLLTLHGKTHPVTLTATKFNCYFSPVLMKSVCGGDFEATIDRTDWGINKYVLMGMTKEVTLSIQVEATKK